MKKLIWVLLLASAPALADAPYCVVTPAGTWFCHYWLMDVCQRDAQHLGRHVRAESQQVTQQPRGRPRPLSFRRHY
jgi:hypothetical protein